MDSYLRIKWVQENLALAISLWAAAEQGFITSGFIPGRSTILRASGRTVEVSTPLQLGDNTNLIRCLNNQIRGNFALSAINTHLILSDAYASSPLEEAEPDLRAARCSLYLLHHTLSQDMITPVWRCPVEYRQRFEVSSVGFVLDATHLDGKEVFWKDLGGLSTYLDLLGYCKQGVASLPESPSSAFSLPLESLPETSPLEAIPATANPRTITVPAIADPRTTTVPAIADPRTATVPAVADPRAPVPVLAGATVAAEPILAAPIGGERPLPIEKLLPQSTSSVPSPTSDSASVFVSACGVVDPEAMVLANELYNVYLTWCEETGREPLSQRSFGMRLTGLGFERKRRGRGRHWWIGLGLAER